MLKPVTLWFTGLSGSGKSTLAIALKKEMDVKKIRCKILDGDIIRTGLSKDLGYSPQDRKENIRRVAEVAKLFNDEGIIVIVALISPHIEDRLLARQIIGHDKMVELYLSADISVCEKRDVKGLYKRARQGLIPEFTGVSSPYQAPINPELNIPTDLNSIEESISLITDFINQNYILSVT